MILFFSKAGLERERKEFVHEESQPREGERKGLFWAGFGFFFFLSKGQSAGRMSARKYWIKAGFSLQLSFGRSQPIVLPSPAPRGTAKIAAFPADAREICVVAGDQPLPCCTHPMSSGFFSELKGRKRKFHLAF